MVRLLAVLGGAAALGGAMVLGGAVEARADDALGTDLIACPRIASPAGQAYLQPTRLQPSMVQAKNKLGCLSPTDAIYGSDGCPLRYCGVDAGVFLLPPASP